MNPHLQKRLAYGKEQLEIGNYGRVERAADELINSYDPDFVKDGLLYKGIALSLQGKHLPAVEYLTTAIEEYPDFEYAYFYRLDSLFSLGRTDEAQADAVKLLELDKTNILYAEKLFGIHQALKNFEAAEQVCDNILSFDSENMEFLFARAAVKMSQKKYGPAIEDYLLLEKMEDFEHLDKASIYSNIGLSHLKLGDFEKAQEPFEKVLELKENDPFALSNLGFVLTHLEKVDEGLDLINDAIDLYPDYSYAYMLLAKVAIVLGEHEEAKECLLKAQELEYDVNYDNEVNEMLKTF